ncbi:hypothetical protein [Actinoplanes auranticolor]|uniref:Uncharacterized protein n=1 Tax=Actinoplanes auranticolor TaxID=47988 RepID=A0A919SFR0_9ACTN|nr:hypothetical protein [Actinoplanes auranticolor]GIM71071.1 hypothetical protein Aau02nite_44030 [Actinoplanes auranticolor]
MHEEHRRGLLRVLAPTLGAAVALAVAFLLAPAMGTDLAAQQARAEFFAAHGWAPVDFGWYGGVGQFGYSLLTAPLGSLIGMRVLGALAAVAASVLFGWLLWRTGVRRPLAGALLGVLVFAANLASGRITFAVGLALALAALCAAADAGSGWRRRGRIVAVFGLGALATWASPVAGLFAGLAGAALLLTGPVRAGFRSWRPDAHWPQALALCLGPVLALAPMALLFGNGGRQPFTAESMKIHVALAVLVAVVVPPRWLAVRIGAALTVVLLLGAFYLPSPIGSNALRLPMLFTIPVLAALVGFGRVRPALLLVAVFWWQPFVVTGDLGRAGSPESRPSFHRPLVEELARREPGRVEVVPLRDHWESVYAAAQVPLARGWERQVDTDRNALFYRDVLSPQDYVTWLRANAVTYVAIAPGSVPDRYARTESALVLAGLPELRPVWQNDTWRLYEVTDAQPLVSVPAELARSDRGGVTVRVPARADVLVRVHWSRWLSVRGPGACLAPGPEGWTELRVTTPGEFRLTSSLRPGPAC